VVLGLTELASANLVGHQRRLDSSLLERLRIARLNCPPLRRPLQRQSAVKPAAHRPISRLSKKKP